MKEEDVLGFIAATITSVWALEVLLLLRRDPSRAWTSGELVHELRGSSVAVDESLATLRSAGLAAADAEGRVRFAPASAQLETFVAEAALLYAEKPDSVIRAIAAGSNKKLRLFADAFRFKE